MPWQLKTYPEIRDAMNAAVASRYPGASVVERSLLMTLIHAAATQDAEQYVQMGRILDAFSLDTASGEDLARRLLDYGESLLAPVAANGNCRVADENFSVKISGSLSIGVGIGASALPLLSGEGAAFAALVPPFNVVVERDVPANRELLIVNLVSGDTLQLQVATAKAHLVSSAVVRSTVGSDRAIGNGEEIYVPASVSIPEITFETTSSATLLDGEIETGDIPITAAQVGSSGNVGSTTNVFFRSKPFSGATVRIPVATGGGRDLESDEAARQRVKNKIQALSRGTALALETAALGVISGSRQVLTAQVIEPVGMGAAFIWIDDGTGTLTQAPFSTTSFEALIYAAEASEARGRLINWPVIVSSADFFKSDERGVATGVGVGTLTDAGKAWAPAAWVGYVLVDDNAQMWYIGGNTPTQLTGLVPIALAPATPSLGVYSIFSPLVPLVLFDVAAMPLVSPTAADDLLVNYSTGEVELNPLKYPAGLVAGDSLIASAYSYATGLFQETAKTLLGDPSDFDTYPGYKAAGTYLEISIPTVLNLSFTIQIIAEAGFLETELSSLVKERVIQYVNGRRIGENIILSELVKRIKGIIGIYDVVILYPTANITILDGYLAKTDTGIISVV